MISPKPISPIRATTSWSYLPEATSRESWALQTRVVLVPMTVQTPPKMVR
nr:hypothetical protein [Pirellulimonas nuda]